MTDNLIETQKSAAISLKPFIAKTERGKKFAAIRAGIVASNLPLLDRVLDRECLAREIAERRGEHDDQFCPHS